MFSSALLVVSSLVLAQVEEPVSHYEHLKGLECYVGEWIGKGQMPTDAGDSSAVEEATIPVTVKWMLNRNLLVGEWKVEVGGEIINEGKWMWWWDTKAKQIRALSVATMGGYGESVWTKQGDKWVAKWTGAMGNGDDAPSVLTTSVVGSDILVHDWTQQKRGDKPRPDRREEFRRVKSK